MTVLKRATCYDSFTGRYYVCNSGWNNWGRWVVAALILVGFLFLFCLLSCITARRRRRLGRQPYYGTGWTNRLGNQQQHQQNPHNTYYAYQQPPAPPYEMNPPQYGQNYRADQTSGVERPVPSYGGYEPPAGPPPAKK